ncbi:hypothetical protein EC12E115_p1-084 (plasmid) [Escherichia coli O145:H28]|nr:hypothetical protein EC10942_p1-71 [Escherichia coli O145:H28]BBK50531.1 hypothetical protein EC10942_p1-75 [Escherichia coli O145:H28]BBK55785.1 hypothetical protein EC112648_p74 [Escherichia coli O145:H28]BBK60843.1 hypothetical protein EC122715_p1-65 [Escherichia coli O145:H28]BBK60846.1 hypothetical protein EC122715_p1-68 [Escherichia coli O145:H28]
MSGLKNIRPGIQFAQPAGTGKTADNNHFVSSSEFFPGLRLQQQVMNLPKAVCEATFTGGTRHCVITGDGGHTPDECLLGERRCFITG